MAITRNSYSVMGIIKKKLIDTNIINFDDVHKYFVQKKIEDATESELFCLSTTIYNSGFSYRDLNVDLYFSKEEKEKYNQIFEYCKKEIYFFSFDILDNILKNNLLLSISLKEIVQMEEKNILLWNWDMKSGCLKTSENNKSLKQILDTKKVDRKKIEQIATKYLKKECDGTPSVLYFFLEDYIADYEIKENKLVLNRGSFILTSSLYEIFGIKLALSQNPQLDLKIPVIVSFNIGVLKKCDVKKEIIIFRDSDNDKIKIEIQKIGNKIFEKIIKSETLNDKLSFKTYRTNKIGIIAVDGFVDAINSSFAKNLYFNNYEDLETEIINVCNFIIEFLNLIADVFGDDLKNYKENINDKWSVNYVFFNSMLQVAEVIYFREIDNWNLKMKDYLLKMNLNKKEVSLAQLRTNIRKIGDDIANR